MRVLYYAMGGGHGHAARGLAVLRRLPEGAGLLLAPVATAPWAEQERIALAAAPPRLAAEELGAFVAATVARLDPELLVVDLFPRGVLGELAPLLASTRAACWLVSRWVEPSYYLASEVRAAIEARYERLVWCESPPPELSALRVPTLRLPPILLRRRDECLPRAEARRALGAADEEALVVAIASGALQHQEDLCRLLRKICQRPATRKDADARDRQVRLCVLSAELPARQESRLCVQPLYPAVRFLAGADLLVCAGGYHAVHEARLHGLPAIHIPQRRRHDDQHRRAAGALVAQGPEHLEALVGRALARREGARPPPDDEDGATRLATLIAARLTPRW